ncbi:hypothetical protein [Sporosarcina sp. P12(2017)]|uniref:hypothetical protein n=1 Tax=Sporosarcina sp. P12(2017) TaxID=2048561 RepID=UPI001E49447B|nr:hypothetical protein [Sporosarcina sp. P12(2017)]
MSCVYGSNIPRFIENLYFFSKATYSECPDVREYEKTVPILELSFYSEIIVDVIDLITLVTGKSLVLCLINYPGYGCFLQRLDV